MADIGPIEITNDPEVVRQIEQGLLASLSSINRQAANHRRTFCLRDQEEHPIGGVTSATAYGWLHIEILWVAENARGRGHGRALLRAAEAFGLEKGCHGAWLETSNAGAYSFYRRMGYTVFGQLANERDQFPPEHQRWFLRHSL